MRAALSPILLLALSLVAPALSVAQAGEPPLIILPSSSQRCWVWLTPPETLLRSLKGFLSDAAVALLRSPALEKPAALTLDALAELPASSIRIVEEQAEPFVLDKRAGKITGVRLSVATAEKLVSQTQAADPGVLIHSPNAVEPLLAQAWLAALPTAASNAWADLVTRDVWRFALAPTSGPRLTAREVAQALWKRVDEAHEAKAPTEIAQAFGAKRLDELELGPATLGQIGYPREMLTAFIAQGSFEEAYLELGGRAADLVTAQRLVAEGTIKPIAGARLLQELQSSYEEAFGALSLALDPRIIRVK